MKFTLNKAAVAIVALAVILFATVGAKGVLAQEEIKAKSKVTVEQMLEDFRAKYKDGVLYGPVDIVVFPSDKRDGGMKYSNVPFVVMIGQNIIGFPNGDNGKNKKPVYVYASTFTIRTK